MLHTKRLQPLLDLRCINCSCERQGILSHPSVLFQSPSEDGRLTTQATLMTATPRVCLRAVRFNQGHVKNLRPTLQSHDSSDRQEKPKLPIATIIHLSWQIPSSSRFFSFLSQELSRGRHSVLGARCGYQKASSSFHVLRPLQPGYVELIIV